VILKLDVDPFVKRVDSCRVAEFRLLGSLEVEGPNGVLALGGLKQRTVLALLLLRAGTVVPSDEITDAVWDGRPTEGSRRSLQVYVSNLRRLLAGLDGNRDWIRRQGPGYLLALSGGELDVTRFERLARKGREELAEGRPEAAQALLREALGLWRGRALADFAYQAWARPESERLEESRLVVLEDHTASILASGGASELVGPLEQLVAEHPYRERLRAQLMTALYRCGRQADALAAFQDARHALVDELGIEPGAELRELERRILTQDPRLDVDTRKTTRLPSGTVTFVFTDVAESTKLLDGLGAAGFARALREHQAVVRAAVRRHGGTEIDTQGDSFFCVFPSGSAAVAAATAIQEKPIDGVRVRVGVHTGEALVDGGRYVGMDVHRAARIAAAGHGGQTLLSAGTVGVLEPTMFELRDLGEHRLKDLSAPVRLYQLGTDEFPPLRSLYKSNLPIPANPLIGREAELLDVVGLLADDDVRIVTITGPGGVGKTRFAVAVAGEVSDGFPDGVWFVPLSSLRDETLVLPTVADVVGVQDDVTRHFQRGSSLLVIDNFEHLVGAAPELARLVAGAPGLRVVVTSREPLRVGHEREYPLPSLPASSSVELFLQRAAGVAHGLEIEQSLAATICERLDRLPLAIELAAVRCRALTPTQILERIVRRLDLLKGGRDADPRQQTLRATIDWSHDLLSSDEQRLFRRLSVFAGGCTLDAAEQVCEADLDTLHSLVEKSLLRFTDGRYWMLETIHEYAMERLDASREGDALRGRHLDFVLELAAELDRAYGLDADVLQRFALERDNFRIALAWASSSGQLDAQLDLVGHTSAFWANRGHLAEGWKWVDSAIRATAGERTTRRARILLAGARFAHRLGDVERMMALGTECLAIARDVGMPHDVVLALCAVGGAAAERGDWEECRKSLEEAIELARELGDDSLAAVTINLLGDAALQRHDYTSAISIFEDALALSRKAQEDEGVAVALYNLGHALLRVGERDEAETAARESLEIAARIESLHTVVWSLALLAAGARLRGQLDLAACLLGAADAERERIGLELGGAEAEIHVETADALEAGLGRTRFDAAIAEGHALSLAQAVAHALGKPA
jgi:predicted ATPase/DNA-binding SARP family transcriptional activator